MSGFTIYECNTKKIGLGFLDKENFYDKLDILHADYVDNIGFHAREDQIESLRQYLITENHAPFQKSDNPNVALQIKPMTQTQLRNYQKSYFKNQYEELIKKITGEMTLSDFARNSQNLYDTNLLLDNWQKSWVYYRDKRLITLDQFIRDMTPNTTYYFGKKSVFAHI